MGAMNAGERVLLRRRMFVLQERATKLGMVWLKVQALAFAPQADLAWIDSRLARLCDLRERCRARIADMGKALNTKERIARARFIQWYETAVAL